MENQNRNACCRRKYIVHNLEVSTEALEPEQSHNPHKQVLGMTDQPRNYYQNSRQDNLKYCFLTLLFAHIIIAINLFLPPRSGLSAEMTWGETAATQLWV